MTVMRTFVLVKEGLTLLSAQLPAVRLGVIPPRQADFYDSNCELLPYTSKQMAYQPEGWLLSRQHFAAWGGSRSHTARRAARRKTDRTKPLSTLMVFQGTRSAGTQSRHRRRACKA